MPLDGLDPLIQRGEVSLQGVVPDDPYGVLLGDQFVELGSTEADLIADGRLEPRGPDERGTRLSGLGIRFVGQIEEHGWSDRGTIGGDLEDHIVTVNS
jgi:hypothetical protein